MRELHLDGDLGNEGLRTIVVLKCTVPEGFDVEPDGGLYLGKRLIVGVPLCDDSPFQTQGVGNIAVRMLLNDGSSRSSWSHPSCSDVQPEHRRFVPVSRTPVYANRG